MTSLRQVLFTLPTAKHKRRTVPRKGHTLPPPQAQPLPGRLNLCGGGEFVWGVSSVCLCGCVWGGGIRLCGDVFVWGWGWGLCMGRWEGVALTRHRSVSLKRRFEASI